MRRPVRLIALVALASAGVRLAGAQQQSPVFRGGVDLVTVDVVVLDKSGKSVPDLRPEDFAVVAGRRARPIVTAEFVGAPAPRGGSAATAAANVQRTPGPTTNTRRVTDRTFLFVVDVDEIRANEGRPALASVGDYLDRLGPDDRVGLVVLPQGVPRLDVTMDHAVVKVAVATINGASNRTRSC